METKCIYVDLLNFRKKVYKKLMSVNCIAMFFLRCMFNQLKNNELPRLMKTGNTVKIFQKSVLKCFYEKYNVYKI